ncbi:MAG: addiction module antidote protein, HigA family [Deltaproteobacteria bacterium]|nr:MAG: addiction module antidote protein, HigA family [Deltaproteobacteria bacterium]
MSDSETKIRNPKIRHPFQFLLTKFIRPLRITPSELQASLKTDEETLNALYHQKEKLTPLLAMKLGKSFRISPELLMRMQIEYELEQTYKEHKIEIKAVTPVVSKKEPPKPVFSKKSGPKLMLLATVNNSIGRKDDHYTAKDLENIFYAQVPETQDHYAVRTMFTEATLQEFVDFIKDRKIPFKKAKLLYHYYITILKGQPNEKFEWLFN